ncbi:MAG: FCD domain-containing protein [Nocardioidaceae bacterium]
MWGCSAAGTTTWCSPSWSSSERCLSSRWATTADAKVTAGLHVDIVEAAASGDADRLRAAIAAHYAPVHERIRVLSEI